MNDIPIKKNLAAAYQIFADLGMDDLTYTHLSARPALADYYFIYPLGMLFEEVSESHLIKVSLDGKILEGYEQQFNQTGYVIHSQIYKHRPEVNAIFHLHTIAGVAVSALKKGLLPLSQFSYHFYNRLAYHAYDSLVLNQDGQGPQLIKDLGFHKAMMLQNHGTLTIGETIQEAFFYAYYLEKACQTQCKILSMHSEIIMPDPATIERAAQDMRAFERDLGNRDWEALLRKLQRKNSR